VYQDVPDAFLSKGGGGGGGKGGGGVGGEGRGGEGGGCRPAFWIGPVSSDPALSSRGGRACQRAHRAGGGPELAAARPWLQCGLVADVRGGSLPTTAPGWTSLADLAGVSASSGLMPHALPFSSVALA